MSEENKQESELRVELRAAIEKHLPSETSGLLRERLDTLVKIEIQFEKLTTEHAALIEECDELGKANDQCRHEERSLSLRKKKVADREAALLLRERACEYREQVIELKEQHATERVAEMRDVVKDVFSNNRYKYEKISRVPVAVDGMAPGHADGGGYSTPGMTGHVETHEQTETVEGEGDAPSA